MLQSFNFKYQIILYSFKAASELETCFNTYFVLCPWRAKDGKTEIEFDIDSTDFRLPEIHFEDLKQGLRSNGSLRPEQNIPEMYYSLRVSQPFAYFKN